MAIFEPYFKDQTVTSVGAEEPRSYFIPYGDEITASLMDRTRSPYFKTLCGEWNFRYYESVRDVTDDITGEACFDDEYEMTDTMTVPRSWQTVLGKGYDKPQYTNVNYPFPCDPPHVPDTNPCAVYSRDFYLSEAFADKSVFLNFEGVDSCFYVWVNGKFVGYGTVSHSSTEFDVSSVVNAGRNVIVVLVIKWCAQSYLEDQDMLRFSGIFREVYLLAREKSHIRDLYIRQSVAEDLQSAVITPEIDVVGRAKVSCRLLSPDGEVVFGGDYKKGMAIRLETPVLWNDEQPRLYNLILTCGKEVIFQNVALRRVAIAGRIFTVNGKKIKIRGVNRHDSHPVLGHTAPYDHFVKDLEILKQCNVNCIRTSHYPNDPRFAELCDVYGFYLVDETDLETHGMSAVYGQWSKLSDSDEWQAPYLDRVKKLFERDKNRGCVIMWSLGNESGVGVNHRRMYVYIKKRMPDAVVHYEGVSSTGREGFDDVTDVRSEMYTDMTNCLARIKDKKQTKPFYLCEYLHAMGNGPGGVKDYVDLIRSHDEFLGGNVWEYCDHSVETTLADGRKVYPYGGDFGEITHDGNFCIDGLVMPDRTFSTAMYAVKNAYMPCEIELTDFEKGEIKVTSWRYFTDLSDMDLVWTVECGGKPVKSGRIASLAVRPRFSKKFSLFAMTDFSLPGEYFLTVKLVRNTDSLAVNAGDEIGFRQFELCSVITDEMPAKLDRDIVDVTEEDGFVAIETGELSVMFDTCAGKIVSIVHDGKEMLASPVELNVMRAPTDNDLGFGNKVAQSYWYPWKLDKLTQKVYECEVTDVSEESATLYVSLSLCGDSKEPVLRVKEYITVSNDGTVSFEFDVQKHPAVEELPRFGLKIVMPEGCERAEYFGMGPYESYADHKIQSRVGYYKTTPTDNYVPYIRPQENGSHCDTRFAFAGDLTGHGLQFLKLFDSEDLSFNVQHFDTSDLINAKHNYDLTPRKETYVFADMRMTGIGSNSCGPRTEKPYRFEDNEFHCGLIIRPGHIQ